MDAESHFNHSILRERIVEHVFVGDALRELWCLGVTDVEVLRSEFDAFRSGPQWFLFHEPWRKSPAAV